MKKILTASILTGALLLNSTTGLTKDRIVEKDRETMYQVALLQSLTMGYFDGTVTVKDLKTHGDTGLGTFEGLDGEMIVLDGIVYRANQNCEINVVKDRVTVPFSNVTFFDRDFSVALENIPSKNRLEESLNKTLADRKSENSFFMIKLHGNFEEILIRSELGQSKPYPTLVESLQQTQKESTLKNIQGTIVGLYCPEFMNSLNSTGWHFHFISDDKKLGGHVLDLNLRSGDVEFDRTDNFSMILPPQKDFQDLNFNQDLKEDIRKAEQDSVQK